MRAYIQKGECSWISVDSCNEVLAIGTEYEFTVKKIDKSTSMIYLTLKNDDNDPWNNIELPKVGGTTEVIMMSYNPIHFKAVYQGSLEVYIMRDELSWFFLSNNQCDQLIGTTQNVTIVSIDEFNKRIFCSIRQTDENPC